MTSLSPGCTVRKSGLGEPSRKGPQSGCSRTVACVSLIWACALTLLPFSRPASRFHARETTRASMPLHRSGRTTRSRWFLRRILSLFDPAVCQQTHCLDVIRIREHIHGIDRIRQIAKALELYEIPCLGPRIARNVQDLLRLQTAGRFNEGLSCSRPRGIQHDRIKRRMELSGLEHELRGVHGDEPRIADAVLPRIEDGIPHPC